MYDTVLSTRCTWKDGFEEAFLIVCVFVNEQKIFWLLTILNMCHWVALSEGTIVDTVYDYELWYLIFMMEYGMGFENLNK